jgi:tRNA(adenine34) deaminase
LRNGNVGIRSGSEDSSLNNLFLCARFLIGDIMNELYVKKMNELMTKSKDIGCIPVAAIVVKDDKIIGSGYNRKNSTNVITDHAEIIAINEACQYLGDWRLDECDLYVTLYPCLMCLGAVKEARIKNVYYLLDKVKNGIVNKNNLTNINVEKLDDLVGSETMLKEFFENIRK